MALTLVAVVNHWCPLQWCHTSVVELPWIHWVTVSDWQCLQLHLMPCSSKGSSVLFCYTVYALPVADLVVWPCLVYGLCVGKRPHVWPYACGANSTANVILILKLIKPLGVYFVVFFHGATASSIWITWGDFGVGNEPLFLSWPNVCVALVITMVTVKLNTPSLHCYDYLPL